MSDRPTPGVLEGLADMLEGEAAAQEVFLNDDGLSVAEWHRHYLARERLLTQALRCRLYAVQLEAGLP